MLHLGAIRRWLVVTALLKEPLSLCNRGSNSLDRPKKDSSWLEGLGSSNQIMNLQYFNISYINGIQGIWTPSFCSSLMFHWHSSDILLESTWKHCQCLVFPSSHGYDMGIGWTTGKHGEAAGMSCKPGIDCGWLDTLCWFVWWFAQGRNVYVVLCFSEYVTLFVWLTHQVVKKYSSEINVHHSQWGRKDIAKSQLRHITRNTWDLQKIRTCTTYPSDVPEFCDILCLIWKAPPWGFAAMKHGSVYLGGLSRGDTPPKDIPTLGAAGGRPKISEMTQTLGSFQK